MTMMSATFNIATTTSVFNDRPGEIPLVPEENPRDLEDS